MVFFIAGDNTHGVTWIAGDYTHGVTWIAGDYTHGVRWIVADVLFFLCCRMLVYGGSCAFFRGLVYFFPWACIIFSVSWRCDFIGFFSVMS